ncbi:archaellin/type IV pilin N-terminal domain-containing protein [Halorubrum vacuolatum]|uniref:Flagellin n=1 Tax=Halorubrum vacuolatum TaxID=63740 RepID=A0A238WES2_HALVU|nr:archaellin/type IV pilin N-terminal domain-containing protein [Halorubrum vacuolatum]SNR45082.1 flagellin FlaB [Halorubrum vacuolatum]
MFEAITNEEERGQVGIGTLIVFIAMVLVAAIAAGVLINTAGFLQTQAEATGEESASQVSDRIEVQSATGQVAGIDEDGGSSSLEEPGDDDADFDGIYTVDFTVTQAPGSDDIDLEDVTAEFITDSGVNQVVLDDDELVEIDGLNVEGDDNVITDSSDRFTVSFAGYQVDGSDGGIFNDLSSSPEYGEDGEDAGSWVGHLEGGDTMEVRFTTAAGATTVEEVRVPDSLIDRDAVSL